MVSRSKKHKKEDHPQINYSLRTRSRNICRNQITVDKIVKSQIDVLARQELNKSHNKDSWKELSLLSEENFNQVDSPENSSLPLSKRSNMSYKKCKQRSDLFNLNLTSFQRRQKFLKKIGRSSRQRYLSTSEGECCYDGSKIGCENMDVLKKSSKYCWEINSENTSVKNTVTDNINSDELSSDELIIDEDIIYPSQDNCDVSQIQPQINNTLFNMSKEIVTNKSVDYLYQSLDETGCSGNKTAFKVDSNRIITEAEIQDSCTSKSDDLPSVLNKEKLQSDYKSDSSISNEQILKRPRFKARKKQNSNPLQTESSPAKVCSNISLSEEGESPKKCNNLHLSGVLSAEKSKMSRYLSLTNSETSPAISIQSSLHENISDFNDTPKKLTDSDYESSSGGCSNKKESSPDTLSSFLVSPNIIRKITTNESLEAVSDNKSKETFDCSKVTVDGLVNHSQSSMVTTENSKLCDISTEKVSFDHSLEQSIKSTSGISPNKSNADVDQSLYESYTSPKISRMVAEMPSNKSDTTLDESLSNSYRRMPVETSPYKSNTPVEQKILNSCGNLRKESITDKASSERNLRPRKANLINKVSVERNLRPRKVNMTDGASVEMNLSPTKADMSNEVSAERNFSPTKADLTNQASAERNLRPRKVSMTDKASEERNFSPTKADLTNQASAERNLRPRKVSMTDKASKERNFSPTKADLTNQASAERNLRPRKVSMTDGAYEERNLGPTKADLTNQASAEKNFKPKDVSMTGEASAEGSNPTLDQSLSNYYQRCCKKLSFNEETSLKISDSTSLAHSSNFHSSFNNTSTASEVSSKTNKTMLDESSIADCTYRNISECYQMSQNSIIDEHLSNAHHHTPPKSLVQGNARKKNSHHENADDENLITSPVHLETSKKSDESPKYNLRKRPVSTDSETFSSSKSPRNPISTPQSSGEKPGVTSQSSCSPGNSRVNYLKTRRRNSRDSSKSKEAPMKQNNSNVSDDDNSCSQSDTENNPKRKRSSSRLSSQNRNSTGKLDESNTNSEESNSKTKDPDLIEIIGEHRINITEIVNKAFSKWRLPLKILKKVQAIDTELIWNKERMFKKITNPKQSKNTKKRLLLEEDMKLMYRRWSEFCKLYSFNRKKPRYFFCTPIMRQYFSSNFINYFTAFISQDLSHSFTQKTTLRNFQYLFEDHDGDVSIYSEYDDAVVLALNKRLSGQVNCINRIAAFALGKSYLSVAKRYLKIRRNISKVNQPKNNDKKSKKASQTKVVNESGSDIETTKKMPNIQITEERLDHLKNKSKELFRLFDAMLDISGHSTASAHKILEKDFSAKDWQRIADKIGNIPPYVAKALFLIKVHPLLTSTQAINKYQLICDILNHLTSQEYKRWEDVKWSEMPTDLRNLKPLFIFTTFVEFVRIQVPSQLQENYKDCMDYLLKEKLGFIKQKIKDKIILDICQ